MDKVIAEGVELKVARIRAGIRQFELAARLGIPPPRLCEIEAGRRAVTPEMVERIAKTITAMASTVREAMPRDIAEGISSGRPEVEMVDRG